MSFAPAEYHTRLTRVQHMMGAAGLDALLLSTQTDICYLTGFLTRYPVDRGGAYGADVCSRHTNVVRARL